MRSAHCKALTAARPRDAANIAQLWRRTLAFSAVPPCLRSHASRSIVLRALQRASMKSCALGRSSRRAGPSGRPSCSKQRQTAAQAANTYGTNFRVTTFGESHGAAVGCVIDGVPPRLPISREEIQVQCRALQGSVVCLPAGPNAARDCRERDRVRPAYWQTCCLPCIIPGSSASPKQRRSPIMVATAAARTSHVICHES